MNVMFLTLPPSQTALCRCSQPLGGLIKRSVEDEQMIQAIVDANPNKKFMYCVDTRPKVCKLANQFPPAVLSISIWIHTVRGLCVIL